MATTRRRPINAVRLTVRGGVTYVGLLTSTRRGRRSVFREVVVVSGEKLADVVVREIEREQAKSV